MKNNVIIITERKERGVEGMSGKVKWFNNEKGYGFIEYNDKEDVFVHYSAIKIDGYKTLNEGDEVRFDLIETDKGLQARNVEVINVKVFNK